MGFSGSQGVPRSPKGFQGVPGGFLGGGGVPGRFPGVPRGFLGVSQGFQRSPRGFPGIPEVPGSLKGYNRSHTNLRSKSLACAAKSGTDDLDVKPYTKK